MRVGEVRPLTDGEAALALEVFHGALDPSSVRIVCTPALFRPFVPGRLFRRDWIIYPQPRALRDYAVAPLGPMAVFVHELTHVWQAQSGVWLPWAKLRAGDGPRAYAYELGGRAFAQLNIEQQAMAVEHAFRLSRGGSAPHPREAYAGLFPFERV